MGVSWSDSGDTGLSLLHPAASGSSSELTALSILGFFTAAVAREGSEMSNAETLEHEESRLFFFNLFCSLRSGLGGWLGGGVCSGVVAFEFQTPSTVRPCSMARMPN